MEASMPASEIEHELEGERPLVFRTDLHGVITYADGYFLKVSGYCAGELYGKSHNIVRHPDVPIAVLMDLWSTVNSGKPWTGIIKSRCKNGNFYWAHATAAPVRAGWRIIGCMMAHRKPTPSQVGEASRLYQRMNEGVEAEPGLIGVPSGAIRQKNSANNLRLVHGLIFMALLLVCAGAAGQYASVMRNAFLALVAAGLALAVWAAFLLVRAKACARNMTAASAAAMAFAGLDSKMAGVCRKEGSGLPQAREGKDSKQSRLAGSTLTSPISPRVGEAVSGDGNQLQQMGEPGSEKITFGANKQLPQLARSASDIAITRARKVKGGAALEGEAGKTVEGIVVAVKRVAGIMAEISAAPAGQGLIASQGAVRKSKTAVSAGSMPDMSDKFAGNRKDAVSAKKKSSNPRALRMLKGEEDEWKDF